LIPHQRNAALFFWIYTFLWSQKTPRPWVLVPWESFCYSSIFLSFIYFCATWTHLLYYALWLVADVLSKEKNKKRILLDSWTQYVSFLFSFWPCRAINILICFIFMMTNNLQVYFLFVCLLKYKAKPQTGTTRTFHFTFTHSCGSSCNSLTTGQASGTGGRLS
jgi:hypothetical protein